MAEAPSVAPSRSRGRWVAAVTLLGAAAIDLAYGREASLVVTLVFAPFVACALASPGDTAVAAVAATLGGIVLGWPDGTIGTSPHVVRVVAITAGGGLAVWLAVERTRRERRLAVVTHVAEVAQGTILRPLPPRIGAVGFAHRYASAAVAASVGGDFYEALDTPWGCRIVVGDACGHGLEAVRLAAAALGEFRSRAYTEPSLVDLVRHVDAAVRRAAGTAEDFATAVFLEIAHDEVRTIRCGHPEPLSLWDREVRPLPSACTLPLGLGASPARRNVPRASFRGKKRVLLYSDGAVEARDASGRDFDLVASFQRAHRLGAEAALDRVVADLRSHAGKPLTDDVVLVLVEAHDDGPDGWRCRSADEEDGAR